MPIYAGMPNESTTVVLGIPIPSTNPVFLAIIGVHVLLGLAAVTIGAVAWHGTNIVKSKVLSIALLLAASMPLL